MKRLSGYDDNCFMKKIFCFVNLIVLSFFFSLSSFALDREPYLTLGLGTGCIVYGDDVETSISGSSRAIATTDALIHLPLAEQLNFMAGTDLVGDLVISGSEHFLRYDYAFLGGLEVLTPLTGLSLSVSYAIGRRTDFVALKDENDDLHTWHGSTKWGNGFKFSLDYDFGALSGGWAPMVGAYWRNMPRGNDKRDNIIAVYLRIPIVL